MIRNPQGSSLIEIVVAVVVILLAFAAIYIGGPAIAEYVKAVPGA